MTTQVFLANVSSLSDAGLFNSLYELMPADRRRKIDEKKFDKDKKLSLGVGALLEYAKKLTGEEAEADYESFKVGEHYFNLSHSGEMAMCIISKYECGCDVELRRPGTLGIADRYFFGEEKKLIADMPSEEKKLDMFFRLWSLKESFMKATHLGFRLALDEFSVVPSKEGIALTQQVDNSEYALYEYQVDGYGCSVCIRDYDGERPQLQYIDLEELLWQEKQ